MKSNGRSQGSAYTADPAGVWFSTQFGVSPEDLEGYGAFDIAVGTDHPLFIDPFLLFHSEDDKYQALHEGILEYLRFLKSKCSATLSDDAIRNWYAFSEVKQSWLGFTVDGNAGHGLGGKFAKGLYEAFASWLRDFGDETVTASSHVEKLALISDSVGRDTISDFTTNLIKHFLCSYTESFAKDYIDSSLCETFAVPRVAFNYNTEAWVTRKYTLPRLGNDFVLLTPIDMLTQDDTWINRSDMLSRFHSIAGALSDAQLRAAVENYFQRVLGADPTPQ